MKDTENSNPRKTAGVIAPPPLIFAICFLAGYALHFIYPIEIPDSNIIRFVGWLLLFGAFSLALLAIRTMKRIGTAVSPYKESAALVTDGPYRFTRNPMYVAVVFLYVGVALLLRMTWPLVTLPVAILIIHYGVILREEKYLERMFADEYRTYRSQVRRWL